MEDPARRLLANSIPAAFRRSTIVLFNGLVLLRRGSMMTRTGTPARRRAMMASVIVWSSSRL
jgi:hypothetical protein